MIKIWALLLFALSIPYVMREVWEWRQGSTKIRTATQRVIVEYTKASEPRAFWLTIAIKAGLLAFMFTIMLLLAFRQ